MLFQVNWFYHFAIISYLRIWFKYMCGLNFQVGCPERLGVNLDTDKAQAQWNCRSEWGACSQPLYFKIVSDTLTLYANVLGQHSFTQKKLLFVLIQLYPRQNNGKFGPLLLFLLIYSS